jgi:hypothetical protein
MAGAVIRADAWIEGLHLANVARIFRQRRVLGFLVPTAGRKATRRILVFAGLAGKFDTLGRLDRPLRLVQELIPTFSSADAACWRRRGGCRRPASRSAWSASSLLALSDSQERAKAGASSTQSKRCRDIVRTRPCRLRLREKPGSVFRDGGGRIGPAVRRHCHTRKEVHCPANGPLVS